MTTLYDGPGPLTGLRVIDCSTVLAGPYCTMLLGDLGAEVVKVEPPDGDATRAWGPPWVGAATADGQRTAAYYLAINRNKRGLRLDLKTPEGAAILRRLLIGADVLVENFRVGGFARLGFDEATLLALNPALVHLAISGYGPTGPAADRPGYDFVIQAASGLMSITGAPDDEGGEPTKVGVAIGDVVSGMLGAVSVLAALVGREREGAGRGRAATGTGRGGSGTGAVPDAGTAREAGAALDAGTARETATARGVGTALDAGPVAAEAGTLAGPGRGQRIDVSLLGATLASLVNQAQNAFTTGVAPGRLGNAHPNIVPYETFATADGAIAIAVGSGRQWPRLCAALGLPALAEDARFASNGDRVERRAELRPLLAARFAGRPTAEWQATLDAAEIPCGPINDIVAAFASPEAVALGMTVEQEHPAWGLIRQVGIPFQFARTPATIRTPPPTLGQDTDAILGELGYGPDEIAAMRARGVV